MFFFFFIILLQLRWPIQPKFSLICLLYQVRILVFLDNLRCQVPLSLFFENFGTHHSWVHCVCAPYLGFWVTVIDYNVTTQLVRHTLLLANISPRDNTANKTSQNTSFRLSKSPVKCGNCSSVPATQICRENKGLILTCVVGEKTHWRRDLDRTAHIFVNTGALSKLQRARGTLSGRERPVEVPPSILL